MNRNFSLSIRALALLLVFNGCDPNATSPSKASIDDDGDGYTTTGSNPDCDDGDPDVYPGAEELCDGIDNDCDGAEDEGLPLWYPDSDGDNFGDEGDAGLCDPPSADGWTPDNTDCDDLEPDVYPGAPELCDGIDNDCDPTTPMDEGVSASDGAIEAWPDEDDDDEGAMDGAMILVCELPDDYAANATDCDDLDFGVNTAAEEWCDGLDNDCDAETDEEAVDATAWCVDGDGDDYTAGDCVPRLACDAATDEIEQTAEYDWDDANDSVYPGAEEFCDGLDNDQNGLVDDEATDADEWWPDGDGDGAGDEYSIGVLSCETLVDMVTNEEDCDDWEARSHSGHTELCGDGIDNDCNDTIDTDCPNNYADYGIASEWFAGDVDGDGAEDVILYLCGNTEPTSTMEFEGEPTDCDLNGDDVTDTENDVCWLVALSDRSSFEAYNIWANTLGREADQRFVLDVDGDSDGRVDLVWVQDSDGDGYGEWHVALADLSTWTFREQPGPWMVDSVAFSNSALRLMGDINGDAFADIVTVDGNHVYTALGTGSSFGAFVKSTSGDLSAVSGSIPYNDPDKFMLADVSGDGQDDLVVFYIDEDSDLYATNEKADVNGAWMVLVSNSGSFSAPTWWLGVGDNCINMDSKDPMGCGDWSDDVFVANYSGEDKRDNKWNADAIGFYELDASDVKKGRQSNGRFFGGSSEYDKNTPGSTSKFNDAFESTPLMDTEAGFGLCATQSTFVAEGARTDDGAYRAILFADVDGDGVEDALAFRAATGRWEVAVSYETELERDDVNDHFSWGPSLN